MKIFLIIVTFIAILGSTSIAYSFFGSENPVLAKILAEEVQNNLNLQKIFSLGTKHLKKFNEKFGFDKWINKGLDQIKDYGLLDDLMVDDYIISTFQHDAGDIGVTRDGRIYNFDNMNDWIDNIWDTSPEYINSKENLRSKANHKTAQESYKRYLYTKKFNQDIRDRYESVMDDATQANPGKASRITAQTNTLMTYQLANLNDTENQMMKLMVMDHLERQRRRDQNRLDVDNAYKGVLDIMKSVPTLGF